SRRIKRRKTIPLGLGARGERNMRGREADGLCSEGDPARCFRGANGDAIDAAFYRKVARQNVVVVIQKRSDWRRGQTVRIRRGDVDGLRLRSSLRDPAAPLGRSREAEVNHVQRSGHTSSALVDGFYINQGKVRAVCMQSARTGMQRQ